MQTVLHISMCVYYIAYTCKNDLYDMLHQCIMKRNWCVFFTHGLYIIPCVRYSMCVCISMLMLVYVL